MKTNSDFEFEIKQNRINVRNFRRAVNVTPRNDV